MRKKNPKTLVTRLGARVANEILMFFRGAKKTAQDISLNEPIDTDKEGNTLTLIDTIAADNDIIEDIDLRMKVRHLYTVLDKVLSPREKEIIVCVVKGMTNKQIADTLCISTHTVITHRRNIAAKLQIHSAAGLTIYAIVNKLVELSEIKDLLNDSQG